MITKQQFARVKMLRNSGESIDRIALKVGISRKTASKYVYQNEPPQIHPERDYRTREDPFADVWQEVEPYLNGETDYDASFLFSWLQTRYPGKFPDGQLRTFQRRVKHWKALHGPAKEVYFSQVHIPGDLCQSDFTHATALKVTIAGVAYEHMLYHFVLTYSNWEWVMDCPSESFESLSAGLQNAIFELGAVPRRHRTDRFTAAVTNLKEKAEFTERYKALMRHYSLEPAKIQVRKPNENGDVEQGHYRFIRALEQALGLRGSKDFESREEYRDFLLDLCRKRNITRAQRLEQESSSLRALPERRVEDYKKLLVKVSQSSTVIIAHNTYSVHSRLIGLKLTARLYHDRIVLLVGSRVVENLPRLVGRGKKRILYRHIIDWLVRKPGAFANYVHRDELYPTTHFRIAYDRLQQDDPHGGTKTYLRLLKLASDESEIRVDEALRLLIKSSERLELSRVQRFVDALAHAPSPTDVEVSEVCLTEYDNLLTGDYYA